MTAENKGPCDSCGMNTCLTDECICPTCKSAGRGKEGDRSVGRAHTVTHTQLLLDK